MDACDRLTPMSNAIDWTHLSENYRGKWVALADDQRTVIATGDTAKEAHEAAAKSPVVTSSIRCRRPSTSLWGMQFKYKRYLGPRGEIERPVIPITLRNHRQPHTPAIGYHGLVDSGSDRCIFSSQVAQLLGIDLTATDAVAYRRGSTISDRAMSGIFA